jgi:hypothetical protein
MKNLSVACIENFDVGVGFYGSRSKRFLMDADFSKYEVKENGAE